MNDLRVLHRTRTQSTHGLIFGASFWIAVATDSIHMKTSEEMRRELFARAVFVLHKTCSYKWHNSPLM